MSLVAMKGLRKGTKGNVSEDFKKCARTKWGTSKV